MYNALCFAINQQRLLRFEYRGLPRVAEPATYGLSTANSEALRAFQIAGRSRHWSPGWRLFDASRIRNVAVLDDTFQIRPDYRVFDKAFKVIYAQLRTQRQEGWR